MAPQPRAQTSPPKPWEQQRTASTPDRALTPTSYIAGPAITGGEAARGIGASTGQQRYPSSSTSAGTGAGGTRLGGTAAPPPAAMAANGDYARRNGAGPGVHGGNGSSRYSSLQQQQLSGMGTRVAAGSSPSMTARGSGQGQQQQQQGVGQGAAGTSSGRQVNGATGQAGGATAAVAGDGGGIASDSASGEQWKQQQQQGAVVQGPAGPYGGTQSSGYGAAGYGTGRYGAGAGMSTGYGVGGYGSSYGSAYGGMGGYGGYGGYSGGMYGGGYGSSYGTGYGSRYGMGGMGMGMHEQYSWLHSIQHFTSSLGYLTEMLGMNTQAIGFVFGNLMGFLEHIGNSLTAIQPWREFPPGHPRHGEPPPTPEEERRRLSRLRVLRFALTIVVAYASFRLSRALHRFITGRRGERPRPAIAEASLEHIYRQQGSQGRRRAGRALDHGRRQAEASWSGSRGVGGGSNGSLTNDFNGADPWSGF